MFYKKIKSINTMFSLSKITNRNVNVICYYLKDFLPPCLQSISQNYYNTLLPLHLPMKYHNNEKYAKNQR